MTGGQKAYTKQSIMWSDVGNLVSFEGVGVLDPKLETYSVFFPENPKEKPDFDGKISRGVVFYKNEKVGETRDHSVDCPSSMNVIRRE